MQGAAAPTTRAIITRDALQTLIRVLIDDGYRVVGPTKRDDAIVYDTITGTDDLPAGWGDHQEAGRYQLNRRSDDALFGYAVGPHSWKRFLHPPIERLWTARRDGDTFTIEPPRQRETTRHAFLGVRACEIHAMQIQDRVFSGGAHVDAGYAARRADSFVVAVNCGEAGGTCFCVSMNTGPKAESGFDLALTELCSPGSHEFLVEVGSDAGARVLERLPRSEPTAAHVAAAQAVVERAAERMGRSLETDGIRTLLQENLEHPRWNEAAERCLSCGNCTMVCPTCFCTTVQDGSDVAGTTAERVRTWDSCFTMDFSYLHGGSVRHSPRSRYRQWMTHKLATWFDQFGTSGCVGCGRCITWCPVGIDITEEAAAIRATPQPQGETADARS